MVLNILRRLFGGEPEPSYYQLIREGAVILDVRNRSEYSMGNIKGSMNIPVETLENDLHRLKDKDRPIITCCASGSRSKQARKILKKHGYNEVYDGGSWTNVQKEGRLK